MYIIVETFLTNPIAQTQNAVKRTQGDFHAEIIYIASLPISPVGIMQHIVTAIL